jgi:hypothetical protein
MNGSSDAGDAPFWTSAAPRCAKRWAFLVTGTDLSRDTSDQFDTFAMPA